MTDEAPELGCKRGLLGVEGKGCSAADPGREVISGMLAADLRFADLIGQGNLPIKEQQGPQRLFVSCSGHPALGRWPTRKSLNFGDIHAGRVTQAMEPDDHPNPIDISSLRP